MHVGLKWHKQQVNRTNLIFFSELLLKNSPKDDFKDHLLTLLEEIFKNAKQYLFSLKQTNMFAISSFPAL